MSNEETDPQTTPSQPNVAAQPTSLDADASATPSALGHVATILLGILLILVITPLSMFLTVMTVSSDIETATPVGWAVGIVFALVLLLLPVRYLSKRKRMSRPNLVLLYTMLTIAVPVMNMGAVRQTMLTMHAAMKEFFVQGTNTYRTAYGALRPEWAPVVPQREALAWNKADRTLRLLQNQELIEASREASKKIKSGVQLAVIGMESPDFKPNLELQAEVPKLLYQDLIDLGRWLAKGNASEKSAKAKAVKAMNVQKALNLRRTALLENSAEAVRVLPDAIVGYDEFLVSRLPSIFDALDLDSQRRIQQRVSGELREELLASGLTLKDLPAREDELLRMKLPNGSTPLMIQSLQTLQAEEDMLRANVMALTPSDRTLVLDIIEQSEMRKLAQLTDAEYRLVRRDYAFRLTRRERNDLIKQAGVGGMPDQNINAFFASLWPSGGVARDKRFFGSLREVTKEIPWNLYEQPILHWCLLFLVIFLFFMCLSEYLRRKWVERENLAFPLVEVADSFLRHDAKLEMAEDIQHPKRRKSLFSPLFWIGFGIAFIIISAEAMGHYKVLASEPFQLYFNVSSEMFTTGWFKPANNVRFTLSPIVLGLAFLISLEISFSIWSSFMIYIFMTLVVFHASGGGWADNHWSGFGAGRYFPFPMEQMAGACLVYASILLIKAWNSGSGKGQTATAESSGRFVPTSWMFAGLILMPLVAGGLLWSAGIQSPALLIACGILAVAIAVAAARVRAETGMPGQHVTYDFGKLPQILGFSESLGANGFASWASMAFFPMTLIFRTLPQHLENMELARRHRLKYGWVASAALTAFLVALPIGMIWYLIFSYSLGDHFAANGFKNQLMGDSVGIAHYSLWNLHYQGEDSLASYTDPVMLRLYAAAIGAGVLALLIYLRRVFLKFPIHPVGYLVVLLSLYYPWISHYPKGDSEASLLWGSVLVAWVIKKVVIKYGGMNAYKSAKPLFVSLVVGAVVAVFAWNMLDLGMSLLVDNNSTLLQTLGMEDFAKKFTDCAPYNPQYY